ncbi:hypothetical protein BH20ACT18_BH20ACT18_06170 [soil metagenome]
MLRSATIRARRPASGAKLGRLISFWGLAVTLGLLLFASSAPSPLYIVYQAEWGFSEITLTSVFAVYALGLLAALVIAGSVSDHLRGRPTLTFALALERADDLRGHHPVGPGMIGQLSLTRPPISLGKPPTSGEQDELDVGEPERPQRRRDRPLPSQGGVPEQEARAVPRRAPARFAHAWLPLPLPLPLLLSLSLRLPKAWWASDSIVLGMPAVICGPTWGPMSSAAGPSISTRWVIRVPPPSRGESRCRARPCASPSCPRLTGCCRQEVRRRPGGQPVGADRLLQLLLPVSTAAGVRDDPGLRARGQSRCPAGHRGLGGEADPDHRGSGRQRIAEPQRARVGHWPCRVAASRPRGDARRPDRLQPRSRDPAS